MKTKIVYIFLFLSTVGVGIYAFFMAPENRWILWVILSVLLVAAIAYGIWAYIAYKKRKTETLSEQEILLKQDREIISKLFSMAAKELGKDFSGYRKPFYIVIGSEHEEAKKLLEQNEFFPVIDEEMELRLSNNDVISESDSYIKFWKCSSAVVLELGHRTYDHDGMDAELWQTILENVKKYRNQQPANGVICLLSCSFIQTGDLVWHDQVMKDIRKSLLDFASITKVPAPLYLGFTEADSIKDFVNFYSVFAEQELDKPLGFSVKDLERHHFDFTDYEKKAKEFVDYFSKKTLPYLKNIDENKARAVLSFPYQMSLFFTLLKENLKELAREDAYRNAVWIRALYFLVPNQKSTRYDLLAQLLANKADFATDAKSDDTDYDKKRFFVSHFFEQAITPAADITGISVHRKMRAILKYVVGIFAVIFLVVFGVWYYYGNWCDYVKLRTQTLDVLDNYEKTVENFDVKSRNSLDLMIISLSKLKKQRDVLKEEISPLNFVSLEQLELGPRFSKFYDTQLQQMMLRVVENIMREDLYASNVSGRSDQVVKGTSAYMMLFDHKILDKEFLNNYLRDYVLSDYYVDANLVKSFFGLMDDLLATNYDKTGLVSDRDLVNTMNLSIDTVSVEDMLYSLIKFSEKNGRKVDVRAMFGPNFNSLYYFDEDYKGYMIPYMFTDEAFNSINISPTSPELKQLLSNLKIVKPDIEISDSNLKDLAHKVQRMYANEYVDHWTDIMNNINVRSFASFDELARSMDSITNPVNGSIVMLSRVMAENTNLPGAKELLEKPKEQEKENSDKESQNLDDTTAKLNGDLIANEFSEYYDFIGVNRKMEFSSAEEVPLNRLMKTLSQANTDLKLINKVPDERGKALFDFVVKSINNHTNDFDFEELIAEETPLIYVRTIASLSQSMSDAIDDSLTSYISENWNRSVYSFFMKELNGRFPFDLNAEQEVNLANMDKFISPNGIIDDFYNKYLKYFVEVTPDGVYSPIANNGFVVNVPYSLMEKLFVIDEIQKVLYKDNPHSASLRIRMTPRKMSKGVKLFEYSDGTSYCSYNQGPRQSCDVVWPTNSLSPMKLSFTTLTSYPSGKSYQTGWGILKAMMDTEHSDLSNQLLRNSQSWRYSINEDNIYYDIQIVNNEGKLLPLYLFPRVQFNAWK